MRNDLGKRHTKLINKTNTNIKTKIKKSFNNLLSKVTNPNYLKTKSSMNPNNQIKTIINTPIKIPKKIIISIINTQILTDSTKKPKTKKIITMRRNSMKCKWDDFKEKHKEDSSWTEWNTSLNPSWTPIINQTIQKIMTSHNQTPHSKIKIN